MRLRALGRLTGGQGESSLRVNTAAQTSSVLVGYGLSFISAPIVVANLGLREFGIWALTGAMAQYGSLLDLGISRAVSRFIAVFDAEGDRHSLGGVIALGLSVVVALGALLLGIAAVIAGPLASQLGGISENDMRTVLVCSAILVITAIGARVIAAYPIGLRMMVVPNVGLAAGSIVNFVVSVGVLLAGADLVGYAIGNAVAGVIGLVLMWAIVRFTHGRLPLQLPHRATVREVLSFGIKGQVVWLTDLLLFQSDKIVIALAVGPSQAGAYELANRVAVAARAVGAMGTSALIPTMAADLARRGERTITESYAQLVTRSTAIGLPPLALCAALAPTLIGAWLGEVPEDTTLILAVLCAAYAANVSTAVATSAITAAGEPNVPAWTSSIAAVVNVALTVALAPLFGVPGVLAGTFVALVLGAALLLRRVHRRFAIPPPLFIRGIWSPFVGSLLAGLVVGIPTFLAGPDERAAQIAWTLVATLVFVVVWGAWTVWRGDLGDVGTQLRRRSDARRT